MQIILLRVQNEQEKINCENKVNSTDNNKIRKNKMYQNLIKSEGKMKEKCLKKKKFKII